MGFNYIPLEPADFADGISNTLVPTSAYSVALNGFRLNPMTECARVRFACSGTTFQAQISRDSVFAGVANYNDMPIFTYDTGQPVYLGKITPTSATTGWYTSPTMSAGNHIVELQTGQGNLSGSNFVGVGHPLALQGTNLSIIQPPVSRRMVFWCDSEIPANTGTSPLGVTDLLGLLRLAYNGRVSVEAMGSATYTMWSNNASLIQRFVRHARGGPFDIVVLLGTNDYFNQLGNLTAQLTTQFTLMAALPNLNKFVILTPLTRGTETGATTLPQYRAQIAAAAAAAIAASGLNGQKITVLAGDTFLLNTSTDFQETPAANALHVNDLGSAKVMTAIRTVLGI